MLIYSGHLGAGKTTLAVHTVNYVNAKEGLPRLDLKKNLKDLPQYAVGAEDFEKKVLICYEQKLPIIFYDESGDYDKQNWASQTNKLLKRTFDMFRAFQVIVVLLLPSIIILPDDLFIKEIPRMFLRLKRPKDASYTEIDGYALPEMKMLRIQLADKKKELYAYKNIYSNFQARFKNLPPDEAVLLDIISTENKFKQQSKAVMNKEGLLNYADISKKFNKSIIWTKKMIHKLKAKPQVTYEKKAYFGKGILEQIEYELDLK